MQIEIGKTYNLNNDKTVTIDGMMGDDPNSIDKCGYGPFYSNEMGLFHIDGRFAAGSNPELDIVSEWVDCSVVEYNMKLSNEEGEYLQSAIDGNADALWHAFTWSDTPHGVRHWRDQANKHTPLDIEALKEIQRQCVTGQVGTLTELGVKAGDVVECVDRGDDPFTYPKSPIETVHDYGGHLGRFGMDVNLCKGKFRIISRADKAPKSSERFGKGIVTQEYADRYKAAISGNPAYHSTPKTWGEMTDAEKGALLLAEHEGKVIEISGGDRWLAFDKSSKPNFQRMSRYRIKPEPVVEAVTVCTDGAHFEGDCDYTYRTHRITFNTIDGEPDCGSVKMEVV